MIGAELEVRDGRYTGFMVAPPLVGEARAAWLQRYAHQEGVDLKHSYAYADSYSDLPLLRAVGNPVAVSPDSALYRYARRRRWPIEAWAMSKGDAARPLPEAGGAMRSEMSGGGLMALALEFFRIGTAVPRPRARSARRRPAWWRDRWRRSAS